MKRSVRYCSLVVILALSFILAGCGGSSGSSLSSLGGPSGDQVGVGNGPVNFGPGTGTPGEFAPPTTPTPPPYDPDTDAALVSISVSPNPLTVYIADTSQLTVTGLLDDGTAVTLVSSSDVSLSFSTAATTAAIVSPTGLVTGIWFGSETVTVTAVVDGVTRATTVPVTVGAPLENLFSDSYFFDALDVSWISQYDNIVTAGGITYPLISFENSFDPLLPSPTNPTGTRILYLEVPTDSVGAMSRGGIRQFVDLPAIASHEAILIDFRAVAKMNPIVITVEVNGASSSISNDFTPPTLYAPPLVPTGTTDFASYQFDVSAFAGETVEVRFLASGLLPPGAPGDTSVAIEFPTVAVWPISPYVP